MDVLLWFEFGGTTTVNSLQKDIPASKGSLSSSESWELGACLDFDCLEAAFVLGWRAGAIVMQVDVCEVGNSVDVCEVGNSIDICEERSQYIGRSLYNSNKMCKQTVNRHIYPQIAISQDVCTQFAGPINIGNPSNVSAQTGGRQTLRHGERSNIAN